MSATSEAPAAFRHSAARPGPLALIREGIDEILSRRRLVRYLVQADLRKKGADTLLGNIWWVLDPLLQMVVYVVFVAIILQASTPDYPLFILSAILPWKWFTASINDATTSVVSQERLIKQIQFPKIVLPVAATTAGIVGFGFGLIALGVIMLFYLDRVSINLVFIPVIAAVQYVFTLGMALAVASVNVFFRDLGNVLRHLLRLWFYLSPALFSLSRLEDTTFMQENPDPAGHRARQPVRDPVRVVSRGHLRHARRWTAAAELGRAGGAAAGEHRPGRPDDDPLQAARAVVRQGPLMAAERADACPGYPARDRGRRPRRPLQPAVQPQDDAAPVDRAGRLAPAGRGVLGAAPRVVHRWSSGESLGGHRAERRRQEHAPPGPRRDHHAIGGRGRRARARVQPADARSRLRPGADRQREHPARRCVPRPRRQDGPRAAPGHRRPTPTSASSSTRRSRPTRRACAPGSDSRSRPRSTRTSCCSTRCSPPATPTSGPSRSSACIELVKAAKGDRARHPRHELGDRVLQPGDAAREGQRRHRGRAGARSFASTRSTRRGARPRSRRSWGPWPPRRDRSRASQSARGTQASRALHTHIDGLASPRDHVPAPSRGRGAPGAPKGTERAPGAGQGGIDGSMTAGVRRLCACSAHRAAEAGTTSC